MFETTFSVNCYDGRKEISIGDAVTVYKCGSGITMFGEPAKLARATDTNLIFMTESGAEVRTRIDDIRRTLGKAQAEGYSVTLNPFEAFDSKRMIRYPVSYWDAKKCVSVKK